MNECFALMTLRWDEKKFILCLNAVSFFLGWNAFLQYDAIRAVNNDNNKRDGPRTTRNEGREINNSNQMQNECELFFYTSVS